jgi:hypothetical protein
MSTIPRFTQKFAASILSVLNCHDRLIFRGYLPFFNDARLNSFVDCQLKMRRKDFIPFLEARSEELVEHAKRMAGEHYRFLQGDHNKETIIRRQINERKLTEGLVAVLCCMETCRGVKLRYAKKRPQLQFTKRPQRVLYYYYLDPDFGLMYVRVQTFLPFTVQVYVNGHDWLARQMAKKKIGFIQDDNAFTQLDDPVAAQRLADRLPHLPWVKTLNRWARLVNPLLGQPWLRGFNKYYWVIDQAEYSTDVLFRRREDLQALYPRLVDHTLLHFSADDILRFLGRRLHPRFDGEVLTLGKKHRWPGSRVKHRMKNNWLKMYDKFGQILRIETVINQPREFRVRRRCTRKGISQMAWLAMNKGVANFYRYHEVALASNQRYLDALAVVDAPPVSERQLDRLSQPVSYHGRRRRGLNLMHMDEHKLFQAILRGEHRLNGFRNRDILNVLHPQTTRCAQERRRRVHRVSRQLQLLRAHGLITKVPRSHRYQISQKGEAIMTVAIRVRCKTFSQELPAVA